MGATVSAEVVLVERAERGCRTVLWCGAPEGGRADWLVEKLAELGVERFQPVECEGARWPAGAGRSERWRRLAIAALRQSRRAFLVEIRAPVRVEQAIETLEHPAVCVVGDPSGCSPHAAAPSGGGLGIGAIGPSGGFSPRERALLTAAGFAPIRLADGLLRTETAAISLAAWWAAAAEDEATGG